MSKIILPGLIDPHVHLRDPNQTHKEDFYTGTCAAIAGGITSVLDMPNKGFHVVTQEELDTKIEIARKKAVCDLGFYFGTDGKNLDLFKEAAKKAIGLKIYLTQTTGHVVLPEDLLAKIFENWPKNKIIVVHIEGDKTELALNLAAKFGNKTHITHVNSQQLLEKIINSKKNNPNLTCDTTPNYLFLTEDDTKRLKGFGTVMPPIGTKEDQDFLWSNLDKIDCIATDHAPHTIEEKTSENGPTGLPGLETMLPLLLTAVSENRLTIDEIIRLCHDNPLKIFGLPKQESQVEIDTDENYEIKNENLFTKCKWSPFDGWTVKGKVEKVFIRGTKVFENGKVLVNPGFGEVINPE